MFKKTLMSLLAVTILIAAGAWFSRIDLMLALVKFKSERAFVIAPHQDIQWQQGPSILEDSAQQRPPNVIMIVNTLANKIVIYSVNI